MILKPEQARAVYDAMVALNNVYGHLKCVIPLGLAPNDTRHVRVVDSESSGRIHVIFEWGGASRGEEVHEDQNAFAKAYGLDI